MSAPAEASGRGPGVIYDCQHRHYEPARILIACGDGRVHAHQLRYAHHARTYAQGSGVLTETPNRRAIDYRMHFRLHRVRGKAGARVFTRMTVTFGRRHPAGGRVQTFQLPCRGYGRYC